MNFFERTELLLGTEGMNNLKGSSVAIFGVGGVGSFAAEAIARVGIGKITLFDNDVVTYSNMNRQIVALTSTIGKYKTEVMRDRIADINPDAIVNIENVFYLPENADLYDLTSFSYIIDAVDTISAKIELAVRAERLGIPIISCMGAGNKLDPVKFKIADIYETKVCPLARIMRQHLRKYGVRHLKVVYSEEEPRKEIFSPVGSISFVPSVAGLLCASEVIKNIAGGLF